MRRLGARLAVLSAVVCLTGATSPPSRTDRPTRKIGSMKLFYAGVAATVDPLNPVVPKNTPAGVRIVVSAAGASLTAEQAADFFGGAFEIQGELSGPGLASTMTLVSDSDDDPLLLPLPPLNLSGDYLLSNLRVVADGKLALDVSPRQVPVRVIEQVLITSVKTRPLTLDELKEKGVVIDGDDLLGFEFTLGMTLESKPIDITFPVVFDRQGVQVPQPLAPPPVPQRRGVNLDLPPLPTIVPLMLEPDGDIEFPEIELPDGSKEEIRIPSVLVIPGDVGFLKQFFEAKLFVANGAPGGSRLTVRDIDATIELPPGPDLVLGTPDDPLALPELTSGIQAETLPVLGVGPDGIAGTTDDAKALAPGEQGEAEFLVRGESEGYHPLAFDIRAVLDGLVTGPVNLKGRAQGGVLVRNPFFNVSFTVPSVVRAQEPFELFVNVHNIGKGPANQVDVSFNDRGLSGLELAPGAEASQRIDTLLPGESASLVYDFVALRTGKVVATYLRFDGEPAADGQVHFTLGVDERGVPLSPDTLVLPASVEALPASVVTSALRVLGQAWGVANATRSILPPDVLPIPKNVVIEKAIALAETGLRVQLGEGGTDSVRNLTFDFFGGAAIDEGFDQLLRSTSAGTELVTAIAAELDPAFVLEGGAVPYERETALIAASGRDFLTFAIDADESALTVVPDAVKGGVALGSSGRTLGILTEVPRAPYTLGLEPRANGSATLSLTLPRGDGTFVRGSASFDFEADDRARLVADPFRPDQLRVEIDTSTDGIYDSTVPLALETIAAAGPSLVSATVIGPHQLDGASPFGLHAAALFDRVVDERTSGDVDRYTMPDNALKGAKRQLSGRLVFLTFERPEGPHVASELEVSGVTDLRGAGAFSSVGLSSLLEDAGAVVGGRVFEADGRPVTNGSIAYANYRASDDCNATEELVFAEVPLRADGSYSLHYVRRDPCGAPFRILYQSPETGELRDVKSFVRADGERIVLDLALFGRGSVTGVVTENGQPAPGSQVVVISGTDTQSGGVATTDGDGRYTVHGIIVGPVSVKAARGPSIASGSGRIARAGTTASVDLVLDPGKISVSGTVSKLEGGITKLVAGAHVVYSLVVPGRLDPVPMGVTRSAADGTYRMEDLPFGEFALEAILDAEARLEVTGSSVPGESVVRNLIIPIPDPEELGTVRGRVQLPDAGGAPAAGATVRIGSHAVTTGADGTFDLPGVPVKAGQTQLVVANDAAGLRRGEASVVVSTPGQILEGIVITLSGLGSARFTVKDSNGDPVSGQLVGLLGQCANLCGCRVGTTDGSGNVTFGDLPAGAVFGKAVLVGADFIDVATGSARIEGDGEIGFGLIQFQGVGDVTGTVFLPGGIDPAAGADVVLTSRVFDRDACELRNGISHRGRTDGEGKFAFSHVNLGQVSATASHPFANRKVGDTKTLTKATPADFTLELVDTTAGILSGTVFLPDGVTPAGAGVEVSALGPLPEVQVRTDDQGRYEFAPLFPQGMYTVTVTDPVTGGVAQERLYLRADTDLIHDFRLKGRGTVRVRVVDAADVPVENAFVKLTEQEFPRGELEGVIEPANQGVITFRSVFEGPFSLDVRDVFARGGRLASVLPGPGDTVEVVVRLNPVGTVKGYFRLPSGTPIPFGVVKLLSGGRVLAQVTTSGAGDVGAFTFDYVPVGPVRLEAQDPLTARSGFATGELSSEGATLTLNVTAKGLGRVEGDVTASGFVPDGAQVELVSGSFRAGTTADASGFYFIEGVPEGQVVITASLGNGFLAGTATDALVGDGTTLRLDVPLRESALVAGTVMRAGSIDPAPPSLVTISVGGPGGGAQSTTTDPLDGSFRFEQVPAGLATLDVQALGSIDKARRTIDVLPGQPTNVLVNLNGIGKLEVLAQTAPGVPTAGKLTLRGTGDFPYNYVIALSADGRVELPEVLAGPVTASLVVDGATPLYGTLSGLLLPGTTLSLTVTTEPSGRVRGTALGPGGPAVGANVLIELSGNRGIIATQTGADGSFDVSGIPYGELVIRVEDPFTGGVGLLTGLTLADAIPFLDGLVIDLDTSPVSVTSVDPPDGSIDVAVSQPVRVTFSDPVALLNNALGLRANGSLLPGAVAVLAPDGLSATVTTSLPDSAEITVIVSTGLVDAYGRRPLSVFTSTFRTVDLSPPKAVATVPPDGAFEIGPRPIVHVVFDEPVAEATNFATLVSLQGPGGAVPGLSERVSANEARFTPAVDLEDDGLFTIVVNGAVDELGNTQTSPANVARFATTDTTSPELSMFFPAHGAWLSSLRPSLQLSAADNASGIDPDSVSFLLDGVSVSASFTGNRVIHTPTSDLAEGSHTIVAEIHDRAGNVGSFSGGFGIDVTPPSQAVLTSPAPGSVLNGIVRFSATASDDRSGLARIDLRNNGSLFASLLPPDFEADLDTSFLVEGDGLLTARAVDEASNLGTLSDPVAVRIDNDPIRVTFHKPTVNQRVRDSVEVAATASEPISRMEFTIGPITVVDDTSPYQATIDLATIDEGRETITATAFGLTSDTGFATRDIVIDRTAPLPPDPDRVFAEPPQAGASLVHGLAGAVESSARVDAFNLDTGASSSTSASADGSFAMSLVAEVGDVVELTATDDLENESGATRITVRAIPTLPPSTSRTTLTFDGVLVDRVGPLNLTPDGELDAVFSVEIEIGDGLTRTLSHIELSGPAVRSTEASLGAALGVSRDADGPLLNDAAGEVSFDITDRDSLTLFASDFGFIEAGATYTVTLVFTDRSEFVASTILVPPADARGVPHSLRITAVDTPVLVPTGGTGTTMLVIDEIRDIEGTPVPDGAKVAVSVDDMATMDPFGNPVRSAGGIVLDGEPAPNDARFRVFTVAGGSISFPYDTGAIVPAPVVGAHVVVQALAADPAGNALGSETIGTLDLNVRAGTDQATVTLDTSSLYADKVQRQRSFTVHVRDVFGQPLPDGSKVLLSANDCAARNEGICVRSFGGAILGSPFSAPHLTYQLFETSGGDGAVTATYELPASKALAPGAVDFVAIAVNPSTPTGTIASQQGLGTALIPVVGPGGAEIDVAPSSVALVRPEPTVQVRVRHVHDMRGNLLPQDAKLIVSAKSCTVRFGGTSGPCAVSDGGAIVDGEPSPSDPAFRVFPLTDGFVNATYRPIGVTARAGEVKVGGIQVAMADASGARTFQIAVGYRALPLLGPKNAVGTADPPSLLADGRLRTATVTFAPVLDAFGNPLPDGARVLASAAPNAGRIEGVSIPSVAGAKVLNGETTASSTTRAFTVEDETVTVELGIEDVALPVGVVQVANVVLLVAGPTDNVIDQEVLGVVPVPLAGISSADASASPTTVEADGSDRRVVVTFSNFRDALSSPVPDGTRVALTTANCGTRVSGTCIQPDVFPTILGGEETVAVVYETFTLRNGQIVAEVSTDGLSVASGSRTAVVQVALVRPNNQMVNPREAVATVEIELVPAGADRITTSPVDLHADGAERLSGIEAVLGSFADGEQVALTVDDCAATTMAGACIPSTGGAVLTAGTSPGDGDPANGDDRFRLFTVTSGKVLAVYSAEGQLAGVGETHVARISVVPTDGSGNVSSTSSFATGEVRLRGTTSTMTSGPSSLPLDGGEAAITFSGIRDSIGNTVPDGTLVFVTASDGALRDADGTPIASAGGTLPDGNVYAVVGGTVTVTYSTAGASPGVARIQIAPARSDGAPIGERMLLGGVHEVAVAN